MNSSLLGKLTSGKRNDSSSPSWLEKHWDTAACLIGIFLVALFIRSYFAYEAATKYGLPYLLGGGADSYYNARIINYIAENHQHLLTDPLRAYPLTGKINTRPPLYQWSVVLGGYLLSPLVGSLDKAINISFIFSSAFWGALTVIPIYLIGKRTFGKKAGIAAALLMTISTAHVTRGVLTNTNHDAFSMFWIITAFFFFLRSLEELGGEKRWVSDWKKGEEIKKGLAKFFGKNKRALLYSAMAGMALGTLALTWKGYSYAVVIILVYFLVQLVIDKFRGEDSLGITISIFVMIMLVFLVALPWYGKTPAGALEKFTTLIQWPLGRYFQIPFVIFLGSFGLGVYFSVTRDLPWVLTFSILAIAGVLFFTLGPDVITQAASQYFIQNKLYSTIAEAQAPSFSRLVLATGITTFFLSFIALPLAGWHLKKTWRRSFLFVLVWMVFAIYMATTATRFIYNASPAFALTSGWVVALIFDKAKFEEFARSFTSHRGNVIRGIREGVKIKHVLVTLFVVFLILTPNAMYVIDSATPYQEKSKYNEQIYDTLPEPLKAKDHNPEQELHYLGAFGPSLDRPTDYWPAAWDWFSQQDNQLPPKERPAFVSWWDYGFQAMNRGDHPTVADNFQHGYRFTGNVLMAQNESEIIGLMIGRQLQLPYNEEGQFEGKVQAILVDHLGKEKTQKLEDIYQNSGEYKNEVLSNPDKYHPRADDIGNKNVMWAMVMGTLSEEDLETLSSLYRDVSYNSGYDRLENRMGYLAVDSRLFPTSAQRTGIFHAPAFLSGHRMKDFGRGRVPEDFFTYEFIDSAGQSYDDPDNVPEDARIVDQKIKYKSMFFNSALYRTFAGYSKHEVGRGEKGIPGLSGRRTRQSLKPMPSWNLTHFKDVYKTAYYYPYPRDEVRNHTGSREAINYYDKGVEQKDNENVTVDDSARSYMRQGVVFLKYYDGAVLKGQVKTETGEPIPNARVTVVDTTDGRGTRHDSTITDEGGNYRVVLPEGNMTVLVSTGGNQQKLVGREEIVLDNEQYNITKEQALRKPVDRDGDGRMDYKLLNDFEVELGQMSGKVFLDRADNGEYDKSNDTLYSGTGEVVIESKKSDIEYTSSIENGTYEFSKIAPGNYSIESSIPGSADLKNQVVKPGEQSSKDLPVSVGKIRGNITYGEGLEKEEFKLSLEGKEEDEKIRIGETDEYEFSDLSFGEYTLNIDDDGYTLRYGPSDLEINETGSVNKDIEIVKAHRLKGEVTKEGKEISNQRLSILAKNYDRMVKTGENGEFDIKLPEGKYQIYGINREGEEVYATLDDILLTSDTEYTGKFDQAYKLTGEVIYDGSSVEKAEIFVKGKNGGEHYITTNSEGRFKTHLPGGQYDVYGWKESTFPGQGEDLYFSEQINLNRDVELNLDPSKGYKVQGKVKRNLFNSDRDGEGLYTDIQISCGGHEFSTATNVDGNYSLYLPEKDCTLTVKKEGYHDRYLTINPSQLDQEKDMDIHLDAKNITVEGNIDFDRELVETLKLEFKPLADGAVSKEIEAADGSYRVELQPGKYEIVSNYSLMEDEIRYEVSDSLSIEPGEQGVTKDLRAIYKTKVKGELSSEADIYFQGPENRTISADGTFSTYLIPGTYSVRAVNPEGTRAVQKRLAVKENMSTSMDLSLEDTYSVNADITGLNQQGMPVSFENLDTDYTLRTLSGPDGELNINVTAGNYRIKVDYVTEEEINGVERDVRYHLSEERDTPISMPLELERYVLNSTLKGKVMLGGSPVKNVEISIKSEEDEFTVQTDEEGEYHLDQVIQGQYTVYISHQSMGETYSYFDTFKMPAEDHTHDISLEEGIIFSGEVKLRGEGVETDLNIRKEIANRQFETDENGSFRILLPKGRYSIDAQETREMDYGSTNFKYSNTLDIQHDEERTIELKKVKNFEVKISELEEKTVSQGETIEFTAEITNAGNTQDEYEFSVSNSEWEVDFEPETVSLGPTEKKQIKVTVQVGENASEDDSIKMMVDSPNLEEKEEKTLPINVKPIYKVDLLSGIRSKEYGEGEFTYSVDVKNKGNGAHNYRLEVVNEEELKNWGWNITLAQDTKEIAKQEQNAFEVKLRSTTPNSKRDVTVELMAVSEGDEEVTDTEEFTTSLPELTGDPEKVEFTTDELALEEEPFTLSNWQWAGIILLVSIAALYVMRKKRWL